MLRGEFLSIFPFGTVIDSNRTNCRTWSELEHWYVHSQQNGRRELRATTTTVPELIPCRRHRVAAVVSSISVYVLASLFGNSTHTRCSSYSISNTSQIPSWLFLSFALEHAQKNSKFLLTRTTTRMYV